MKLLLRVTEGQRRQDVLLEADPATPMPAVAEALWRHLHPGTQTPVPPLWLAARPIGHGLLRDAGLMAGAVLRFGDRPHAASTDPWDRTGPQWELAVVGGASSGRAVVIDQPAVTIGRGEACDLDVPDPEVSRGPRVRIQREGADWRINDDGSANGVLVEGLRVDGTAVLRPGDLVELGQSALMLRPVDLSRADIEQREDSIFYNRPPRLPAAPHPSVLEQPAVPKAPVGRTFSVIELVAPMLFSVTLAVVLRRPLYLLLALGTPLMLLANVLVSRRSGRRSHREAMRVYEERQAEFLAAREAALETERRLRRIADPDPAAVHAIATGPLRRLWERAPEHEDYLRLRIGLGTLPALLGVREQRDTELAHPPLAGVPVTIPLSGSEGVSVTGIAAPRPQAVALARSILCGIAVLHSPRHVRLALLTPDAGADWEWLQWLPHLRTPFAGFPGELLAGTTTQAEAMAKALLELADRRADARRTGASQEPHIVVLVDHARELSHLEAVRDLLERGPAGGVFALCLAEDEQRLPHACRATVLCAGDGGATVSVGSAPPQRGVLADGIDGTAAERVALALAPMREPGTRDRLGAPLLPRSVRHLDLLGDPDPRRLLAAWAQAPFGQCATVIGVSEDGPLTIDLDRDGPHALVAGMTGAGKSALLQTIIASLAASQPPELLNFLLVDFKGTTGFSAFEGLPHLAGFISNLDGPMVERMLRSLEAELRHREQVLDAKKIDGQSAKDLHEYWRHAAPGDPPLARLVIVVDEFAELDDRYGDARGRFVHVGRIGRALGVHLLLATQTPGAVVSEELQRVIKLWISLLVQGEDESRNVIGIPDAARLPTDLQGRGYARVGGQPPVQFQAGYLGMVSEQAQHTLAPPRVHALNLAALAQPFAETAAPSTGRSDLAVLVEAMRLAEAQRGGISVRRPWRAPLPAILTPAAACKLAGEPAPTGATSAAGDEPGAPVGLLDLPEIQAQRTLRFDPFRPGHWLVVGGAQSGKTSTLRTIAGMLARTWPSDRVHLYVLDGGGRMLDDLADLPHCGAVVRLDDAERLERLLVHLEQLVEHGKERRADSPAVVLLIDRYEAVHEHCISLDGGARLASLERVLREGPAAGVNAVVSGDHKGFLRLSPLSTTRLVLRPMSRDDLVHFQVPRDRLPSQSLPGRGVWWEGGAEVQVCLLQEDATPGSQAGALREIAALACARDAAVPDGLRARALPPLPAMIEEAELHTTTTRVSESVLLVGMGGLHGGPVGVPLRELTTFVVTGRRQTGKSNSLLLLARQAAEREGPPVVLIAPRASALRELTGHPGVAAVLTDLETLLVDLSTLLANHGRRLRLFADDAEVLDGKAGEVLETFLREAPGTGSALIFAADLGKLEQRFSGWLFEARQHATGLVLQPRGSSDGNVLSLQLPRGAGGPTLPPGRAILAIRGMTGMVQVARATAAAPPRARS